MGLHVNKPKPSVIGSERVLREGDAGDGARLLIVFPLLCLVVYDLLLEVSPLSWPLLGLVSLHGGEDQRVSGVVALDQFQIEALAWLHGRRLWLIAVLDFLGNVVAILNVDLKADLGVLWDQFSIQWRDLHVISEDQVRWAGNSSLISCMQLLKSQLKAFVGVVGAEGESDVFAELLNGVGDDAAVLELTGPAERGQLTAFALLFALVSSLKNVDGDSVNVNISVIIHVVLSFWTKDIWVDLQVDGLAASHEGCY